MALTVAELDNNAEHYLALAREGNNDEVIRFLKRTNAFCSTQQKLIDGSKESMLVYLNLLFGFAASYKKELITILNYKFSRG